MDWSTHREEVETLLMLKVPLKTGDHIEKAIVHLNDVIIEAATRATSDQQNYKLSSTTPDFIKSKIKAKRKLRKKWQRRRYPKHKEAFNKTVADLKSMPKAQEDLKTEYYLVERILISLISLANPQVFKIPNSK